MSDLIISPSRRTIQRALKLFYKRHSARKQPSYINGIAIGGTINGTDVTEWYFDDAARYLVEERATRGAGTCRARSWRWPQNSEEPLASLEMLEPYDSSPSRTGSKQRPMSMVYPYDIPHSLQRSCESRTVPSPYFVITKEGRHLLDGIGIDWFRDQVFEPEKFQGEPIGHGSEGNVYRISLCGHDLALKLFSEEAQKLMERLGKMFRAVHHPPIFFPRLGWTRALLRELDDFPMRYTKLSYPTEYAAGASYFLSEYVDGTPLSDVLLAADFLPEYHQGNRERGEHCIERWGITRDDLIRLEDELKALVAAINLLQHTKGSFLYRAPGQADFSRSNLLIKRYSPETRCFDLSIIDQGQRAASIYVADSMHYEEDQAREYKRSWNLLASQQATKQWLERRGIPSEV